MDILEVAKNKRRELAKEIAKLDEFIAMGEELSKSSAAAPSQGAREESSSRKGDDDSHPMPLRQFKVGG